MSYAVTYSLYWKKNLTPVLYVLKWTGWLTTLSGLPTKSVPPHFQKPLTQFVLYVPPTATEECAIQRHIVLCCNFSTAYIVHHLVFSI
jgi:hypothetical protein